VNEETATLFQSLVEANGRL